MIAVLVLDFDLDGLQSCECNANTMMPCMVTLPGAKYYLADLSVDTF